MSETTAKNVLPTWDDGLRRLSRLGSVRNFLAKIGSKPLVTSQGVEMSVQNRVLHQKSCGRSFLGACTLKNKLWSSIKKNRYYFLLLGVYFLGFLLITPLGRFNPGVPPSNWVSLININRWDDTAYYMVAKSLIVDGDLDYSDEQLLPQAYYKLTLKGNPVQGAGVPIGSSILWAPFILVAHMLTKLLNFVWNMGLSENGYAPIYLMLTCIGSSLYTFLSLLLSFKILTRYFSPKVSALSVLTVFVGNSLFYNTYIRMLMSHSPEVFTIALFTLFFLNAVERKKILDYLFFGISAGLMVIVRYDNAMFLILPLVQIVFSFWSSLKARQWRSFILQQRNYCLAFLASFVVIFPQFLHFFIQSGTFVPTNLEGELARTFGKLVEVKQLLVGDTRNILWGKPIVAIGAVGSLLFIKQNRFLGVGFFSVIVFGILWLFWRPHTYWWGMDFGIRHLIKLSLPLAFGYAAIIKAVKIRHKQLIFCSISAAIMLWEYFKIIQTPRITPIKASGFLKMAALKIPDLISNNLKYVLTGAEGSYLKVVTSYGLGLEVFNLNDWVFLVLLPLCLLMFCVLLLWIFISMQGRCSRNSIVPKIAVVASLLFFGSLSLLGFAYPEKGPEEMYRDFRNGGMLAFAASRHADSLNAFRQALSIRPEGDDVVKAFHFVLDNKIEFPFIIRYPEFEKVLSAASEDSNVTAGSVTKTLLEEISIVKQGYYDFGTAPVRRFLRKGWSRSKGLYVWAVGTQSEMDVYAESVKSGKTLIFKARPYPADQSVKVILNGKDIGTIVMQTGWHEYRLQIDAAYLKLGKNSVTFKFRHAKSPSESGGRDTRKLAVAFDWLKLEDAATLEWLKTIE